MLIGKLRSETNVLNNRGSGLSMMEFGDRVQQAIGNRAIKNVFKGTSFAGNQHESQQKQIISGLLAAVDPVHYTAEYQRMRYGKAGAKIEDELTLDDILPTRFKGSHTPSGFNAKNITNKPTGHVDHASIGKLAHAIATNPVAARIAESADLGKGRHLLTRNDRGVATLSGQLSRTELEKLMSAA